MIEARRGGWRRHHLLGAVPAIGMLGGIVFANRVHPLILGLPFLFAWIAGWVVATSLVMWWILRLDRAHERGVAAGSVHAGHAGDEGDGQ
jgi:hypothetical protein